MRKRSADPPSGAPSNLNLRDDRPAEQPVWSHVRRHSLVVLTATDNTIFPQLAPDQKEAAAALWSLMHREVAALSSRGVHRRVANTSHFIQLDQPEAVIEAIDERGQPSSRPAIEAQPPLIY